MSEPRRDPWLPTPGLLTTSRTVKEVMLHDWGSPKTRQWRFTPPTHVLAALEQALAGHAAEGGVAGREDGFRVGRIGRLDQTP